MDWMIILRRLIQIVPDCVHGVVWSFGGDWNIDPSSVKMVLTNGGFAINFSFKREESELIDHLGRKCDNNFSVELFETGGCLYYVFVGGHLISEGSFIGLNVARARALYDKVVDCLLAAR